MNTTEELGEVADADRAWFFATLRAALTAHKQRTGLSFSEIERRVRAFGGLHFLRYPNLLAVFVSRPANHAPKPDLLHAEVRFVAEAGTLDDDTATRLLSIGMTLSAMADRGASARRVQRVCQNEACGKTFSVGPGQAARRFCTMACYRAHAPAALVWTPLPVWCDWLDAQMEALRLNARTLAAATDHRVSASAVDHIRRGGIPQRNTVAVLRRFFGAIPADVEEAIRSARSTRARRPKAAATEC